MQGQFIYIYKITNVVNQKIYIGQTINPSERWSRHKNRGKNIKYIRHPLYCSMKKYGIDKFIFEIINQYLNADDADINEIKYIEQYKSRDRQFGYNIDEGGQVNRIFSEETKHKMSLAKLGIPLTEEHKNKLKGRIAWNKGLPSLQKGSIRFTIEQQNEICKLYETLNSREIANIYKCSPTTIIKVLRLNNLIRI
jgi:group I intron endonuclease